MGASTTKPLTVRELVVHAALALAVVFAMYPAVFLRGEIALPGHFLYESQPWQSHMPEGYEKVNNLNTAESLITFYAWSWIFLDALKHGEWPLWNAYEMTGLPFLANYQSVVFYPTRVLFLMFDPYTAATLFILVKIWICGMTAYVFARGIRMSAPAARFLSFGWMGSGFCITWLQWPLGDVAGWIPVAFLGAEWVLEQRFKKGFFAMALGAVLLLLGGHPESAFAMGAGLGIYFFIRLALQRRCDRAFVLKLAVAGAAWGLALMVCTIVILPFVEYCVNSYTMAARHSGEDRTQFLKPIALTALWIQRFVGFNGDATFWGAENQYENSQYTSVLYPGIVAWIGLSALLARHTANKTITHRIWSLLIPTVLALLLAFEFPTLQFYRALPFLGSMWGVHFIAFSSFGLITLAAIGIDNWFALERRFPDLLRVSVPVAAVAALCGAFYWFYAGYFRVARLEHYIAMQYLHTYGFLFAAFILVAVSCFVRRKTLFANGIALLLCADLLLATHNQLPTCPRAHMFPATDLTAWLQQQPKPCRVDTIGIPGIRPALMIPYGVEELWGYDGIYPERIKRVERMPERPSVWRQVEPLLATSYYIMPPSALEAPAFEHERFEVVKEIDGLVVLRDLRAYPRTFFLPEVRVVSDADAVFDAMGEPRYDSRRTGLTDAAPKSPLPITPAEQLGAATITARSATRLAINAKSATPSVLFVSEAYYPGWRAFVDGAETEVFPLYHAFRGIVYPGGNHTVEFRYEPKSFYIGLYVSIAALSASSIFALVLIVRKKNAPVARGE